VDDLPKTLTGKIRRSELRRADAGEEPGGGDDDAG
jgi:acyl-coenzyme A synthetase/AMP-(fatty) acid ligase